MLALPSLAVAGRVLAYRPFLEPLKVWDYWPWLIIPLCFAVSLVYKCVRVQEIQKVWVDAAVATAWVLAGMGAAAAVLLMLVNFVAR